MTTEIHKHCRDHEYYVVSNGTCRSCDTIPAMLDALRILNENAFDQTTAPANGFATIPQYALDDKTNEWWGTEAADAASEFLYDALNENAPDGFHFSASEGDGACIGFWKND